MEVSGEKEKENLSPLLYGSPLDPPNCLIVVSLILLRERERERERKGVSLTEEGKHVHSSLSRGLVRANRERGKERERERMELMLCGHLGKRDGFESERMIIQNPHHQNQDAWVAIELSGQM